MILLELLNNLIVRGRYVCIIQTKGVDVSERTEYYPHFCLDCQVLFIFKRELRDCPMRGCHNVVNHQRRKYYEAAGTTVTERSVPVDNQRPF